MRWGNPEEDNNKNKNDKEYDKNLRSTWTQTEQTKSKDSSVKLQQEHTWFTDASTVHYITNTCTLCMELNLFPSHFLCVFTGKLGVWRLGRQIRGLSLIQKPCTK